MNPSYNTPNPNMFYPSNQILPNNNQPRNCFNSTPNQQLGPPFFSHAPTLLNPSTTFQQQTGGQSVQNPQSSRIGFFNNTIDTAPVQTQSFFTNTNNIAFGSGSQNSANNNPSMNGIRSNNASAINNVSDVRSYFNSQNHIQTNNNNIGFDGSNALNFFNANNNDANNNNNITLPGVYTQSVIKKQYNQINNKARIGGFSASFGEVVNNNNSLFFGDASRDYFGLANTKIDGGFFAKPANTNSRNFFGNVRVDSNESMTVEDKRKSDAGKPWFYDIPDPAKSTYVSNNIREDQIKESKNSEDNSDYLTLTDLKQNVVSYAKFVEFETNLKKNIKDMLDEKFKEFYKTVDTRLVITQKESNKSLVEALQAIYSNMKSESTKTCQQQPPKPGPNMAFRNKLNQTTPNTQEISSKPELDQPIERQNKLITSEIEETMKETKIPNPFLNNSE